MDMINKIRMNKIKTFGRFYKTSIIRTCPTIFKLLERLDGLKWVEKLPVAGCELPNANPRPKPIAPIIFSAKGKNLREK
jgi:hypothetical protein